MHFGSMRLVLDVVVVDAAVVEAYARERFVMCNREREAAHILLFQAVEIHTQGGGPLIGEGAEARVGVEEGHPVPCVCLCDFGEI